MKQIILASKSAGRRKILALTGLKFKVVPSDFKEDLTLKISPHKLAKQLSLEKARTVAKKVKNKNSIIIGADTIVVHGKKVLGKPGTKKKNVKMLKEINGKVHSVITGLTIIDKARNKTVTKSTETKVYIKKLTQIEIVRYVDLKESWDKAGGYAAQGLGATFIEKIEGDYFNVIGLPLATLAEMLKKLGINII